MGVCKCKQRNVTNQFCYVCRMNVCESCMVKDHQRCIIKSYVHWLQDSDYSATCSLCLDSIQTGEVIRLTCYDLFHWDCFNAWALKFSETADSSYFQCPDCKAHVFPSHALVSPVADVIRQRFSTVAWGRRGLQLPQESKNQNTINEGRPSTPTAAVVKTITSTPISTYKPIAETIKTPFVPLPKHQQHTFMQQQQQQQLQYQNPSVNTYSRDSSTTRKVVDTTKYEDSKINLSYDHDDNKYKRKGFTHWLGNLLRLNKKQSKYSASSKRGNLTFKRMFALLTIIVLVFMTVVFFMSTYGRDIASSDPMLDPDFNPNIKVARKVFKTYDK